MKKFLTIFSCLIIFPVYAACPIDSAANTCSIADAVNFPSPEIDRGFDTNVGNKSSGALRVPNLSSPPKSQSYISSTDKDIEPAQRNYKEESSLRNYRQNKSDFSYNASCQFGFCNQTGTPQLFQQR